MEKLKKIAVLYDPYLDTLGGGERYILSFAEALLKKGWQVIIAWKDLKTLSSAAERFGLDISNLEISVEYFNLFRQRSHIFQRVKTLKDIDLVFFVTDGSVPILFGKQTLLHYQVPFTSSNRFAILNKLKLVSINQIITNSKFTEKIVRRSLKTSKVTTIYPPVDVDVFNPETKKKNYILNVGRFASPSHSKRQDVLINAFKSMIDQGLTNWTLILAGGANKNEMVLENLKDISKGYPIQFHVNPKYKELIKLYNQSSIYWHAAGFGVDQLENPEATEHFGITTVESMSAGCVPIVINKGGQPEIVKEGTGYLFETQLELIDLTKKLIKNEKLRRTLAQKAIKRSKFYSKEMFTQRVESVLK